MNTKQTIMAEIDRKQVVKKIHDYYGSHCMESIAILIKRDLKDLYKMQALMNYVGINDDEFFFHMGGLFFEIFNKMTIKRIKLNMSLRDES